MEDNLKFTAEEIARSMKAVDTAASNESDTDFLPDDVVIGDSAVVMKERFEVNYAVALPEFNVNGALAYKAIDRVNPTRDLFALVCNNDLPPRNSILADLKTMHNDGIINLVEYGMLKYLPNKTKNMVLIYEMPRGPKLSEAKLDSFFKRENSLQFKSIMASFVSALDTLRSYGITHRAIRLNNVFFRDTNCMEVVLGDCAASFPALFQPDVYETIESLVANKYGRGNGTDHNDIYATAVTLISMILKTECMQNMSTAEIIRKKMRKGSYLAIVGDKRFPKDYVQFIKGMLEDDWEMRWKLSDITDFFDGKVINYSGTEVSETSAKSLVIGGERFYSTKEVALALLYNQDEAWEQFRGGKIAEWAKNHPESDRFFEKIDKLQKQSVGSSVPAAAQISKLCIYIAPSLPLKVGEFFLFPDGVPKSIFYAVKKNENLQAYIDLFNSDLVRVWYQEQKFVRSPTNASEFKVYINRKELGYGIERIMYDFDDDLPCISPLLGGEFVNSSTRVLRALDNFYANNKDVLLPYDKAILAYLRCKMGKRVETIFYDLNSKNVEKKSIAILKLYAWMQNKYGPSNLSNLSMWLLNLCTPNIAVYHNLRIKKALEKNALKVAKNGRLQELLDLLNNSEAKLKDRADYADAMTTLSRLTGEYNRIARNLKPMGDDYKAGLKITSFLAILIMLASFTYNVIMWVIK